MPQKNQFDTRLLERNFRKGLITREEYDTYLSQLEDCSDNAELVSVTLGTDDAEDSQEEE